MRAMILAAGLGQRMRPLTLTTPKPLLPVADKPLIVYQIENLVRAGITEIVINHAWLGEQIEAYLGEGRDYGCAIRYSSEQEPLETAGGIVNAMALLDEGGDTPFMLVNGDVFTTQEYAELDLTLASDQQAKLWLVENQAWHPQGDFALNGGSVSVEGENKLTFAGISLLRPSLFAGLVKGESAPLAPLLKAAMEQNRVVGEQLTSYWNDVGTPERLADVESFILESR
jgi:MurNAc alpha-1-phosphate uridylyltransferase